MNASGRPESWSTVVARSEKVRFMPVLTLCDGTCSIGAVTDCGNGGGIAGAGAAAAHRTSRLGASAASASAGFAYVCFPCAFPEPPLGPPSLVDRAEEKPNMRLVIGMILGVLLTVATAFVYDSITGRAPSGLTIASAEGRAPVVNWDVVRNDWDSVKQQLHDAALDLERGWRRIAG